MIIARYERDWITLNEDNYFKIDKSHKYHLIKLDFKLPDKKKLEIVLNKFWDTKRFIIDNNIKFYNFHLKNNKKFYVMNKKDSNLITFLKKNNKCLINFNNLEKYEINYIMKNPKDVLDNVEAVLINYDNLEEYKKKLNLNSWSGNVLIER